MIPQHLLLSLNLDPDTLATLTWANQNARVLFDGPSSEWAETTIEHKVAVLRQLSRAGVLNALLNAYFAHYLKSNSHVLGGFGMAMGAYQRQGLTLRIPSITVMDGKQREPGRRRREERHRLDGQK